MLPQQSLGKLGSKVYCKVIFFFFFLRIYLFICERHTERGRDIHRQREKQAPHREPDAGLDPRTLGSCPEAEAEAQPVSHPGIPCCYFELELPTVGAVLGACFKPWGEH